MACCSGVQACFPRQLSTTGAPSRSKRCTDNTFFEASNYYTYLTGRPNSSEQTT